MDSRQDARRRWCHLTPDRFFIGLLVVQVLLFLSEPFQCFTFSEQKGCTVLIAVGVVCISLLATLLWSLVCLLLRRRFQFGVRSLLVFVAAASIPLGWFAWQMQRARRQREAVEAIMESRGLVFYDYRWDEDTEWLNFKAEPKTPKWLRESLGDDFFYCPHTLSLSHQQVRETDLKRVGRLPTLRLLCLNDTRVTDAGLRYVKGLTELKRLSLGATQVSDAGLEQLKGLTGLKRLDLSSTQVTDAGMEHLTGLADLRTLDLFSDQITDEGLAHLTKLANLEVLGIKFAQVTDEGVRELQQALPNCKIDY